MFRKDPLLLVILWWTALVAGILVWLPLVRGATQGNTYRWALAAGIGGRGIGGAAGAAIIWVVRDLRARKPRESAPWVWTRGARVRLALLIVIVPIEAVLFRSGGIQSIQNVIGVGFVGWQWVLVNRLLAGARRSSGEGEI